MKVINQRKAYLEGLRQKTIELGKKVVADYNKGIPVDEFRQKYINPRTGKPYSRQRIYAIISQMRGKS